MTVAAAVSAALNDASAMAAYYGIASEHAVATPGRRAAMRKRLKGTLEEIAQRAADTRRAGGVANAARARETRTAGEYL
jgi:hypothetical protein